MQEIKQVLLKDAVGKEIKAVHTQYDELYILYTDGTFSFYEEYTDWDVNILDDTMIKYENLIHNVTIAMNGEVYAHSAAKALIDIGLIDQEQLFKDAEEKIKARQAAMKSNDIAHLKELMKKYPEEVKSI